MTTKTELLEMIRNGENSGVEFKRDDIDNRKLAKELVAFSNFEGGMVLLGVEDDGTVSGITRQNLEEWVMTACPRQDSPRDYSLLRGHPRGGAWQRRGRGAGSPEGSTFTACGTTRGTSTTSAWAQRAVTRARRNSPGFSSSAASCAPNFGLSPVRCWPI
jgi:hypothetical protein